MKSFKNLKLQQKYSMFLAETRNAVEVDSRTSKYKVLKSVDSQGDCFWFLGKGGSIRFNRKNKSTTSMDFSKYFKEDGSTYITWEKTKNV